MTLKTAMQVGIFVPSRPLHSDEINFLLKAEETATLALERFLAQEITLQDYADILDVCGIDIDEYLQTVDDNCALIL